MVSAIVVMVKVMVNDNHLIETVVADDHRGRQGTQVAGGLVGRHCGG